MSSPTRLLIDTDPGIDDALAILLALASPEVQIEGISVVFGNCAVDQGVRNALALLDLAHAPDIPVARGMERPLVQPLLLAPETHGDTGLGYARLPEPQRQPDPRHGMDLIIETARVTPGEITLVALGPLTNLAMALRREPRLVNWLRRVIIMGGAIRHQGNTTPLAEFNVYCDPHAAHIVYHSGLPITLVPLDVTYQVVFKPEHVNYLLSFNSPVAHFIAEATRFYMEFHDAYQQIEGCVINDPLALALAFAPDLVGTESHFVDVDISGGVSMGKTFADFYRMIAKPANMEVALTVDSERFLNLFVARMAQLCRTLTA
ncbi:nucleoside hydrolase [uncultured Thermanaerothrix sp.]|uniref:nucleoside hydrolase n=1 Tax=uncultured Thermanaerothrix sp. TaxID=1195149 RepID=UPI002634B4FB|nr:nucleoside hydrolase [uncultured Thermanaerothrix sp.]